MDNNLFSELLHWTLQLHVQAGSPGSSLDELSTTDVILRTLGFLAILLIASWFARRLKR
jgi:hypothetical protein